MKERIIKYSRIFLPVLFTLYLGGIVSFTHVHIENGITIVHSHPYQKGADGTAKHHHSGSELQLLSQVSTILIAGTFGLFAWGKVIYRLISALSRKLVFTPCLAPAKRVWQQRGPPAIND